MMHELTDSQILDLIRQAIETHQDNAEADSGEKHLASAGYLVEAIIRLADPGKDQGLLDQVRREGWLRSA